MTNPYPADFRERALRMLAQARPDHLSDFAAASHVAGRLGVNPETLRLWKKRADIAPVVSPGRNLNRPGSDLGIKTSSQPTHRGKPTRMSPTRATGPRRVRGQLLR
jgi:transposase